MTTYHMKQSIAGCLRNNRIGAIDFLEDGEGNLLSDADARVELNKLLEMGHTVMPVGDDCKGFDVFGGGCPGHELLAGSDLVRAMLSRGDKYVLMTVSDQSEEHALRCPSIAVGVFTCVDSDGIDYVETSDGSLMLYYVAINNMGEPLTAKKVGL